MATGSGTAVEDRGQAVKWRRKAAKRQWKVNAVSVRDILGYRCCLHEKGGARASRTSQLRVDEVEVLIACHAYGQRCCQSIRTITTI